MNVRHIVHNLTAFLLTFGLASSAFAQGSGSSEGSGTGDSGGSKPAKVRQKFTLKLPEEYRSKDVDKDNQIGMYEWPKSDWAKFRELDLNGDGFLTAKELTTKSKAGRSESRVASSDRRGDRSRGPSAAPSSPTTSTPASDKPAAGESTPAEAAGPPTTLAASAVENQAANFFKTTDKDENGKISEDEVKKSILVRVKFEKAGIKPDYPLNQDEFVRLWVQAAGAAVK